MNPFRYRLASRTILATGLALALPLSGIGPAFAQEPSLCDALRVDDLHALGAPRYDEPIFGSPTFCVYEKAPDQAGPHSLTLSLSEIPFGVVFADILAALRAQNPAIVDVGVAGMPGYIDASLRDTANVTVGLDGQMLSVLASISGSAEAKGLDPTAYALSIAELVVPRLAQAPAASGGEVLEPPAVDGIEWRVGRTLNGVGIEDGVVDVERDMWDLLLASSGASPADAAMVDAVALDTGSGERVGSYVALRIRGADAAALVPVLVDWIRGLGGQEGLEASGHTIAGKDVTRVCRDGVPQGFVRAGGDTLYLLTMPEDIAAAVVAQLP